MTWSYLRNRHDEVLLSRIPSPKKYPFIQHALKFAGKSPQEIFAWLEATNKLLGPVFHFKVKPFDNSTFFISDPKVAEALLSSHKILDKHSDYDFLKPWLGTGLLLSTGDKWFKRRKILTPAFHFQILEKFVTIMNEQSKIFVKKLETVKGREVNIFPLVNLLALDVICGLFGLEFYNQFMIRTLLLEAAMGCKINAQLEDSKYVRAVHRTTEIFIQRRFSPLKRSSFIYQFTGMYRREKKALEILHGFTDQVIRSRRDELLNRISQESFDIDVNSKKKVVLLDILLQATVDGKSLTNMDIREEVDTFMFAGHDTVTSGLSFCLYNIAKYPDVQQKIFNEIQALDSEVCLSTLNNMNYLELVIKESLRLFPPVPHFARKLTEEATLGGYTFPKYSNLTLAPYLMGRDAKRFPNPLEFIPERFAAETTYDKFNPFSFIPFSAGKIDNLFFEIFTKLILFRFQKLCWS